MRRTFKYGFFQGLSPICQARITEYPELAYVADLAPEQLHTADRDDLTDAQHQWAYSGTGVQLMQRCFEDGCGAVRPVPLHAYTDDARMFIMQEFMRRNLPALTTGA